jgi:hypothetical protein
MATFNNILQKKKRVKKIKIEKKHLVDREVMVTILRRENYKAILFFYTITFLRNEVSKTPLGILKASIT